MKGFLCLCSECSLEVEEREERDGMRAEIREKRAEIVELMRVEPVPRRNMKKAMKLSQRTVKLLQQLGLRAVLVAAMIEFYDAAVRAREMDISCENEPEIFKQEALKYAQMFGDSKMHYYNKCFNK